MAWPDTDAVNFTPTSREDGSPASATAGAVKSKIVSSGVTAVEAVEGEPVPTALVAATVKV